MALSADEILKRMEKEKAERTIAIPKEILLTKVEQSALPRLRLGQPINLALLKSADPQKYPVVARNLKPDTQISHLSHSDPRRYEIVGFIPESDNWVGKLHTLNGLFTYAKVTSLVPSSVCVKLFVELPPEALDILGRPNLEIDFDNAVVRVNGEVVESNTFK